MLAILVGGCAGAPAPTATADPFVGLADRSDQAFRQGLELYGQGLYREALNAFQQAQTLSPAADPRIDQMIERSRTALVPSPTAVPPPPTALPVPPTPVTQAMSAQAPDADLSMRYFGPVTLAVVPGRDSDSPAATQFFFQDQIGLHIAGLKQHLRLPLELRVFNADTGLMLADVQSETNPSAQSTPNAQGSTAQASSPQGAEGQGTRVQATAADPAVPTLAAGSLASGTPLAQGDIRLSRFWDTYVWYHVGGENPGRYRAELYANGVLTNAFDYSVVSIPVSASPTVAASTAPTTIASDQPASIDGRWNTSLAAASGPGSVETSGCVLSLTQDVASLAGSADCEKFGAGSLNGTVTGQNFLIDLLTDTSLRITGVVATDGTGASGTYTSSDGTSGTFTSTRAMVEAPVAATPAPVAAAVPAPVAAPAAPAVVAVPTAEPTLVPIPTPTPVPTPANAYTTVVGGAAAGLDVDAGRGRFYLADSSGVIWSSDSPTGQQRATLGTPMNIGARLPVDLTVDQSTGYLYLSTHSCSQVQVGASAPPGCVLVVDGTNGALLKSIALPGAAGDLRIDSDLGLLFVALPDQQALAEVDVRAGKVIHLVARLPQITSLAVDPIRHAVYAAHLGGQLTVLDARSGEVTARVSLTGPGLTSVATARGLAYAVNTATHELAVVEPVGQSVTRYPLSQEPAAVAASELTGIAYVLSSRADVILQVDPTDGTEIGRVLLGSRSGHPAAAGSSVQTLRPRMVLDAIDQTVFASLPDTGSLAAATSDQFPLQARAIPFLDLPEQAVAVSIPGVLRPAEQVDGTSLQAQVVVPPLPTAVVSAEGGGD